MPKDVAGVMDEYKKGQLHSGSKSGPKVTDRKQALAIAMSEQRARTPAGHHQAMGSKHMPPPPGHHQSGQAKK